MRIDYCVDFLSAASWVSLYFLWMRIVGMSRNKEKVISIARILVIGSNSPTLIANSNEVNFNKINPPIISPED